MNHQMIMQIVANNTSSLVYKSKLISGTDDNNVNNVKLVVPLKYVSSFFQIIRNAIS